MTHEYPPEGSPEPQDPGPQPPQDASWNPQGIENPPPAQSSGGDTRIPAVAGVGIGCGAYGLAFMFATMAAFIGLFSLGPIVPIGLGLLATAGGALMFISPKWRRAGVAFLITGAVCWVIVLGPCITFYSG